MPKHIGPIDLARIHVPRRGAAACAPAPTVAWLLGLFLLGPSGIGCTYCRNPVGDDVVAARQMSLRGLEAMQRDEWEEAEGLLEKAVQTSPVDERARCRYAETLWRRGARENAIAQMEEAVRLSGNDSRLLVQLGEMHLAHGDLPRASRRAGQAIAADSRSAAAWALRGDVLRKTGNGLDALLCYHRALTYQEHFPHVQLSAAEIYRESGRPQRALSTLELLADQYPPGQEPQEVLLHKGLALRSLGRFEDAADCLATAAKRGEPTVNLLVHLSEAHLLAGDPASASLAINQALARDPRHAAGLQLREQIESRQQQMAATLPP